MLWPHLPTSLVKRAGVRGVDAYCKDFLFPFFSSLFFFFFKKIPPFGCPLGQ